MGPEFDRIRNIVERELSRSWESNERFAAAYQLRDVIDVEEQMQTLSPEQRVNLAWEVQAGVYGNDSPYHSYYYS